MGHTRRVFLERAARLGIATTIAGALPVAARMAAPGDALAQDPLNGATLQAFADTILPGRKAQVTDLGNPIHPEAIIGVDALPGAVEADALALFEEPLIGFQTLAPPFLLDLQTRSLQQGGPFLALDFDARTRVVTAGLDFSNPDRVLWEAAAAIPFTAFCAAALIPEQTAAKASGYRVMGLPGVAPAGYRNFSYRRKLSRERTKKGYLA